MKTPAKGIANLSPEKKRALLAQLLQKKAIAPTSFPLSYPQQRLWFLDQLESKNPTYNIPAAFRLKGSLDLVVLEETLNQIQRRHKVLQTKFETVDGKPVQIIDPEMMTKLSLVKLQGHPESEREAAAWCLLEDEIQQPFELSKGPLLRSTLFRLNEEDHILLLTMHHIISDGWSMGVFKTEIVKIYQALKENRKPDLPDLPQQYSDFSVRQREWLKGEGLARQLSYWKKQLKGAPQTSELPVDRPRSSVQTFNGTRQSITLTKELTRSLKKLSLEHGCTLFMTLLTAFKIILYRYTDQADLSVGMPIANRDQDDIENLIGFFVNTLVLRNDLTGNPTFREMLARVRDTSLAAYDNQGMPFEKLVEELRPQRDLSRSPFFQVLFSIQNTPTKSLELPGLTIETLYAYNGKAKFDLSVYMWEKSDQLGGVFEYNTDLFMTERIERMIEHFKNLLESLVENPGQHISDLQMLTEWEKQQLLVEWNATEKDYPSEKCFHQLFESQAEQTPDSVAVEFGNKSITYGELNARANQLAHYLQKLGVGPDILVGICVERSLEMLVGLLGIMKAGGAYVPLDPSYPKERLTYMVEDAEPRVLLTQNSLRETIFEEAKSEERTAKSGTSHFSLLASRVLCLDSDWQEIAKESELNPETGTQSTNLAYVIYTSGSTGKPKGVAIQHQTLVNFLNSMREEPGLTREDVLLAVTTLSFDIAGLELYLPLLVGSRVILASGEVASDGSLLSSLLTESGATVMQATPATWRLLIDSGWQGSDKLKMLCGGEALPRELANRLLETGGSLWNMYGPTETTIWSSVFQLESKEGLVPVGPSIANTQIYILDKTLQPVPVGVFGQLHIGGDGLGRGYLKRPDLTAEKFIPNPFADNGSRLYRTGDLARYLPNGSLELQGRLDHQVKIRGFRIELGEIEATLAQHPGIDEVVVVTREDESTPQQTEKYLAAYVIFKTTKTPTVSELRRFLMEALPDYMVPTSFVYLDAFPLTPNGKVDRKALPAPDGVRPELESAFVAPQNEIERSISGVWQEVLGVQKVGVDDNFFDLGGHSLLLVQVQSKFKKIFERDISIIELFKYPTINTLVKSFSAEKDESVDFLKIHEKAKKQKDALTRQRKLKEVKKNDGRLEYA